MVTGSESDECEERGRCCILIFYFVSYCKIYLKNNIMQKELYKCDGGEC